MSQSNEINRIARKRTVIIAIAICLLATVFLYWNELNSENAPTKNLTWTTQSFLFLSLALIMMLFRDLAYMVRIRVLASGLLNWKQSFNVILLWEFASALSPGVVGGSAVALFILRREKIPIAKSTALVIITLIFDNLFYILMIPFVFLFVDLSSLFPADFEWLEEGQIIFWTGYSIIVLINIILIVSVFFSPGIISFFVKLIFKLPFLRKRKLEADQFSEDIKTTSKDLKGKPLKYWLSILGTTIWSWVSRFLVVNFVLLAFIELGLIDQFIILARQLLMWLIMLVTPTPGGSGMAEYLFSSVFSDYILAVGISGASLALIWRTISYYPYLVIGSILLPKWLGRNSV